MEELASVLMTVLASEVRELKGHTLACSGELKDGKDIKRGRESGVFRFSEAGSFRGGVAQVRVGGKLWRMHNVSPHFTGGELWLIDRDGNRLRSWKDPRRE